MNPHAPNSPATVATPPSPNLDQETRPGSATLPQQMQAVVLRRYGDAQQFAQDALPRPRAEGDEVVIRVEAAGVNPIDWRLRKGSLRWLNPARFPLVLGFDVAGTIVEVGDKAAQRWEVGQEVYCFLDNRHGGGYAQYAKAQSQAVASKPAGLSFEEAAAVPLAAVTALQSLRDHGRLVAGKRTLINGASGGVGSFAVQIAKALGAHVTAVSSGKNEELVRELGADDFIDYTQHDFQRLAGIYDLVFDAVGKASYRRSRKVLRRDGVYVTTLPTFESILFHLTSYFHGRDCRVMLAKPSGSDLREIAQWIEDGKVKVIIDQALDMADVASAHRISEEGHVRGKLVLRGLEATA